MIETFLLDAADLVLADPKTMGDELTRTRHADILILCFHQGEENLLAPRLRQQLFDLMLRHRQTSLGTESSGQHVQLLVPQVYHRDSICLRNSSFFTIFRGGRLRLNATSSAASGPNRGLVLRGWSATSKKKSNQPARGSNSAAFPGLM